MSKDLGHSPGRLGAGRWRFIRLGVALVLLAAGALWVVDQFGWTAMPEDAPVQVRFDESAWTDASRYATQQLAAMRSRTAVPGASAAVAVDGKVVWAAAVGWTDVSMQAPVTPDTTFRIGSTSKAVTATLLARLEAAGVLSLSDTVGDHWPSPLNPAWIDLRLDRLMSHTAGIPGYENNRDIAGFIASLRMRRRFGSVEEGLTLVAGSPLLYPQGAGFQYSSFDVNLAARTAEMAASADYAGLLALYVSGPLGIDTLYLADHGDTPASEAARHAMRWGRARAWGPADVSQRWPGGGLAARSSDLVTVAGAWLDPDFLPRELAERYWTPMRLNSGEVNEQNYAIGWRADLSVRRFGTAAPVRLLHHGGVSRGAMSWLALYPDLGIAVAVNINAQTPQFEDFAAVEQDILRLFAKAAGRTPAGAAQ